MRSLGILQVMTGWELVTTVSIGGLKAGCLLSQCEGGAERALEPSGCRGCWVLGLPQMMRREVTDMLPFCPDWKKAEEGQNCCRSCCSTFRDGHQPKVGHQVSHFTEGTLPVSSCP